MRTRGVLPHIMDNMVIVGRTSSVLSINAVVVAIIDKQG